MPHSSVYAAVATKGISVCCAFYLVVNFADPSIAVQIRNRKYGRTMVAIYGPPEDSGSLQW